MIYVTENGVSEKMTCTELCDDWRIQYYKDYINEMLKGNFAFACTHTSAFLLCVKKPNPNLVALCGVAQRSKMESTSGATLPGPCSTSLSGMKATPRGLACTMWTSGTKTSLATPRLLFSFTNVSSAPMDFPIRER